ncbi:hypothetical protein HYH02_004046 [Chlamydomonas schloesseri]|uniref:Non-structural maintenance of chromosomes element 4 n=1 Tax=Chlamydomonas schloesseri TaxID=2026947 RepID=A0A836B9D5_9CHLO|nr:hypothetical protein HYH02_004046 [Chlamydomonas schloesseri]|eukprot:KAG2451448.1 hypothetical protein HYH02_004046 [Chlamydomonas schloesseri]
MVLRVMIDLTLSDEDDVPNPTRAPKRLRQASIEESLRGTPRAGVDAAAAAHNGTAQHAGQDGLRTASRRQRLDGAGPSQQPQAQMHDAVTPKHQRVQAAGGAAGSPGPGPSRTTQPAAPAPAARPRAPPPPAATASRQAATRAAAAALDSPAPTNQGPHERRGQPGQANGDGGSAAGAGPSSAGPNGTAPTPTRGPRATANGTGGGSSPAGLEAGGAVGAGGAAGGGGAAAAANATGSSREQEAQRHSTWRALHSQDAELAAQRDALAGTDAGSSMRFLSLAQRANDTLQAIHEPAMAARDAAQHHLLTDAALQASSRLERTHGSHTAQDLINAILVLYKPRRAAAGEAAAAAAVAAAGAAGPSGAAGAGVGGGGGGGANPYAGTPVDWGQLGWDIERLRRPARGPSVLLGPMEVRPKERKAPAARRPRDKVAEVTRAQELQDTQDGSGHDSFTSAIMEEMLTALRRVREQATAAATAAAAAGGAGPAGAAGSGGGGSRGRGSAGGTGGSDLVQTPCGLSVPFGAFRPYREVVLDHAGFAQTMENASGVGHLFTQEALLFHLDDRPDAADNVLLAACTKDEMAAMRLARKRGASTVAAGQARGGGGAAGGSTPAAAAGTGARNQETSHMLVSYDMPLWRSWCERTPPEACLMRSRPCAQNPDALDAEGWADGGAAGGAAGAAGGTRGPGTGAATGARAARSHSGAGAGPSGSGRRAPQ